MARVLMVTASDVGGSSYWLARHLRRRGSHDVRVVVLEPDLKSRFPTDLTRFYDGGEELRTLAAEAEVLHVVDLPPLELDLVGLSVRSLLRRPGAPRLVLQVDGNTDWRPSPEERSLATDLVTTRAELMTEGSTFLPPYMPIHMGPWTPLVLGTRGRESVKRPGVVFFSSRAPIDRRPDLEDLVDRAEDAVLRLRKTGLPLTVEHLVAAPHRQVLRRRRGAHLCLQSSQGQMGRSALESLLQGVPVVTDLAPETSEVWTTLVGAPPPVVPSAALSTVLVDIEPRAEPGPQARAWAARALDPERWFGFCDRVWSASARLRAA